MRESPVEVAVGAAVLIAAVGFGWFAVQATGLSAATGDTTLTASFRSIEGVTVGTEVRLAGVRIGTVTATALNPDTYRADTVMTLTATVPIPDDSSAVVASEGLLGGTYVEIVPGGSLTYFADAAEIIDTQGSVSLLNLLIQVVGGQADGTSP
jgi:phospholipid/cholesterol/gamma-HCH transport system substrate-binding protein